jgi:AraC-like DNA-binding protein
LTGATDQPQQTRRAVAEALCAADALGVTEALRGELHPLGVECLRWAIERAQDSPSVEQLAEASGLTSAGLARELSNCQMPSPARFIFWGRLFRAASLLSDAGRRAEDVAFRLNYSSASALTRALRRETGCSLRELRRRGTTACVLDSFVRRDVPGRARGRK